MNDKKTAALIGKLGFIAIILTAVCVFGLIVLTILNIVNAKMSNHKTTSPDIPEQNENTEGGTNKPDNPSAYNALLGQTEDQGMEYIDKIIFLGESTTAHLVSRGHLSGGKDTNQVWSGPDSTLMLDTEINSKLIKYPDTSEVITIEEAVKRKKPEYMVITLGLNGIMGFKNNRAKFDVSYQKLIDMIKQNSPDTKIILQSEFPLAADYKGFSEPAVVVNQYIDTINSWTLDLANKNHTKYLDTASVLKNSDGFLTDNYNNGDGLHISEAGYAEIIKYIRTHAYIK